jgi:hypothetical protein
MRLKIPWVAVLPFSEEYFFNEHDFPDLLEREATRQKVAKANDCEVIRTPRDASEPRDPTWRRTALADGGFRCVDECDVFIAVLPKTNEPEKKEGDRRSSRLC